MSNVKWEHDFVLFDVSDGPKAIKENLNNLGLEGWELCSVISIMGKQLCCFLKKGSVVHNPEKEEEAQNELLNLWSEGNVK